RLIDRAGACLRVVPEKGGRAVVFNRARYSVGHFTSYFDRFGARVASLWNTANRQLKQLLFRAFHVARTRPDPAASRLHKCLHWLRVALFMSFLVLGVSAVALSEIAHQFTLGFGLATLLFPLHLATHLLKKACCQAVERRMANAGCDVWLVPWP